MYCMLVASYNLSSLQCGERRQQLSTDLDHVVEYQEDPDVYVKQSLLLDLLGLTVNDKSILSRTITSLFPSSTKKKMVIEGERMYPFYKVILLCYTNKTSTVFYF